MAMEREITRFKELDDLFLTYGREIVQSLGILIIGLVAIKYLMKAVRLGLSKLTPNKATVAMVSNIIHVILLVFVIAATLHHAGLHSLVVLRMLVIGVLAVVAIIFIFRPYVPALPFKPGNFIQVADLLGLVESTSFLNTRLKTFDGKTVFIPNRIILNDTVINYHYIPYRQIRLVVTITYESDLLKAKNLLWTIFSEEPRILNSPAGRVFVINLAENGVELAIRPWVKNSDYWRTRCDLLEIIKLRFDQEGITIAYPQHVIHLPAEVPVAFPPGLEKKPAADRGSLALTFLRRSPS
jgi:small conductance mechanosensitive channel